MVSFLETIRSVALLALGFGFVVFWHELGHFLAAKWAGVKVEQFAVGFGQALISWRKGVGFRFGNSQKEFQQRIDAHLAKADEQTQREQLQLKEKVGLTTEPTDAQVARAVAELGLGETEYRFNWIPLGGYVKMLGQDDLRPNSEAEDPRAFNRQSIAKRMVIVSAGVIMNVILAAIGFMVLFLVGFHVPPSVVGLVTPGSPAQNAKLQPGDRIISIDGKLQHDDWTKVQLSAALCDGDAATPVVVERLDNGVWKTVSLQVKLRQGGASKEFLEFGIAPPTSMRMPTVKELKDGGETPVKPELEKQLYLKESLQLQPGDVVTAVNGKPVPAEPRYTPDPTAFLVLDNALQASEGKRVTLTVQGDDGKGTPRPVEIQPHFLAPFGSDPLNFAGLIPRMLIGSMVEKSPNLGRLLPGDVILSVSTTTGGGAMIENPSINAFRQKLNDANTDTVDLSVLRDGQTVNVAGLKVTKISKDTSGLMIGVDYDDAGSPVVAQVLPNSAAQSAMILPGSTIVSIDEHPVANWFDVRTELKHFIDAHPSTADLVQVSVHFRTLGGESQTNRLSLSADEVRAIENDRYIATSLRLMPVENIRQTTNPLVSAKWGVIETRDFILQFYLTLRRMLTGGVAAKNLMGPVGIFQAGTSFASKGNDWLIWFLAMISANLAVVNFLPIPIVDGGLFTFLILEKIKGRPLSPKTQAIAQYVGMALLLGVFIFVTWQDVVNFQFRMR